MKNTHWTILFIIPFLVACQQPETTTLSGAEDEQGPAMIEAADGTFYSAECVQNASSVNDLDSCEVDLTAKPGDRGFHSFTGLFQNWYGSYWNNWGYYPSYYINNYSSAGSCGYWGWGSNCNSFLNFFGWNNNGFNSNGSPNYYNACDQCMFSNRPRRCQRRNQCFSSTSNGSVSFPLGDSTSNNGYTY